jgi:hypothetical protein
LFVCVGLIRLPEISELYLGSKQPKALKAEVVKLAQAVNPAINVFDTTLDEAGQVTFQTR